MICFLNISRYLLPHQASWPSLNACATLSISLRVRSNFFCKLAELGWQRKTQVQGGAIVGWPSHKNGGGSERRERKEKRSVSMAPTCRAFRSNVFVWFLIRCLLFSLFTGRCPWASRAAHPGIRASPLRMFRRSGVACRALAKTKRTNTTKSEEHKEKTENDNTGRQRVSK